MRIESHYYPDFTARELTRDRTGIRGEPDDASGGPVAAAQDLISLSAALDGLERQNPANVDRAATVAALAAAYASGGIRIDPDRLARALLRLGCDSAEGRQS